MVSNIAGQRPSHTTTETAKKSSYRPYTLQLFFTTATIFSTILYMDNKFLQRFFQKNLFENLSSVRGPQFNKYCMGGVRNIRAGLGSY